VFGTSSKSRRIRRGRELTSRKTQRKCQSMSEGRKRMRKRTKRAHQSKKSGRILKSWKGEENSIPPKPQQTKLKRRIDLYRRRRRRSGKSHEECKHRNVHQPPRGAGISRISKVIQKKRNMRTNGMLKEIGAKPLSGQTETISAKGG